MAWGRVTYRVSSLALPALGGRSFAQKKNIWLQSTPAALITSYHTILDSLTYAKYLTFHSISPPNHIARVPYSRGTKSTLARVSCRAVHFYAVTIKALTTVQG